MAPSSFDPPVSTATSAGDAALARVFTGLTRAGSETELHLAACGPIFTRPRAAPRRAARRAGGGRLRRWAPRSARPCESRAAIDPPGTALAPGPPCSSPTSPTRPALRRGHPGRRCRPPGSRATAIVPLHCDALDASLGAVRLDFAERARARRRRARHPRRARPRPRRLPGRARRLVLRQRDGLRALERERSTLHAILDHLPVGVFLAEAGTGKVLLVNQPRHSRCSAAASTRNAPPGQLPRSVYPVHARSASTRLRCRPRQPTAGPGAHHRSAAPGRDGHPAPQRRSDHHRGHRGADPRRRRLHVRGRRRLQRRHRAQPPRGRARRLPRRADPGPGAGAGRALHPAGPARRRRRRHADRRHPRPRARADQIVQTLLDGCAARQARVSDPRRHRRPARRHRRRRRPPARCRAPCGSSASSRSSPASAPTSPAPWSASTSTSRASSPSRPCRTASSTPPAVAATERRRSLLRAAPRVLRPPDHLAQVARRRDDTPRRAPRARPMSAWTCERRCEPATLAAELVCPTPMPAPVELSASTAQILTTVFTGLAEARPARSTCSRRRCCLPAPARPVRRQPPPHHRVRGQRPHPGPHRSATGSRAAGPGHRSRGRRHRPRARTSRSPRSGTTRARRCCSRTSPPTRAATPPTATIIIATGVHRPGHAAAAQPRPSAG